MNDLNHSRALAVRLFAAGLLLASACGGLAGVHYVDVNSTNATAPYTNWTTAATRIQDAVDAAVAGDEVVVTNGTYASGGRVVGGASNRVAVDKPLALRSVNGPQFTAIHGAKDGLGIRCVYLTNSASLSGFTLTNGAAYGDSGGGLFCESPSEVVSNCVITGNSALGAGGGAAGGTLNNCMLTRNSAAYGGGAFGGTLNNCTISGNSASSPGGGGGAGDCTLNNCTVTGNSASGVDPISPGGGVARSTLNNCIVYFNTTPREANYSDSTLNYCCTTPQPANGVGNITLDPQLASSSHVSAGSPCRGAGSPAYASGTDIDGEAWASPPSIGCDEYHAGALTGPLSVAITASLTNVAEGFAVQLTALIEGRTAANSWDFGDGAAAVNQPYTSHAWIAPADYAVVLRAYNESQPGGISATVTVHVVAQPVHYVAADSANPAAPYTSWATAATNIQDAVDAVTLPGALVLVTNGIYAAGGRPTLDDFNWSRVAVDKPLRLRSINGPQFTTIVGGDRCVYLTNGAALSGFTLTNGFVEGDGGGVFCKSQTSVVSNCVVSGNRAGADLMGVVSRGGGAYGGTLNNCTLSGNSAEYGGAASGCILNNCTLSGNSAHYGGGASGCILNNCTPNGNSARYGGGASGCSLNNCTLSGNSAAYYGGGAYSCTLSNCILYFNTSTNGPNYDSYSTLNYSCTTPMPTNGFGNITNAPLFVDQAHGNLRLQSDSPCINAGLNALAPTGLDLDGNSRTKGGTVDMGAYEFQSPTSMISYAWLQQYALPTDGSADYTDPDGDGLNNWQEWRCGTDPTNALSALRLLATVPVGSDLVVRWESVADRTYFLERSATLSWGFRPLATGIPGQPGATTYTDTNAIGVPGPLFYRVGVSAP